MGLEDFLNKTVEIDNNANEIQINAINQENQIATQILEIENQIANYKILQKELETKAEKFKSNLMNLMIERGVTSWKTPNKITFTVVAEKEPEEVIEKKFDIDLFKEKEPTLYEKYSKEEKKMKAGRKGYLRITLPKEK